MQVAKASTDTRMQKITLSNAGMPERVKEIGKELVNVNQLMQYPKSGPELKAWTESICELLPETTSEHVKFVIDLQKMGRLDYDPALGVQNIIKALDMTHHFYSRVIAENNYRERRNKFVLENGISALLHKIFIKYKRVVLNDPTLRLQANQRSRAARKINPAIDQTGNYEKIYPIAIDDFDFINGNYFPRERVNIYKAVFLTFYHPSVSYNELSSAMSASTQFKRCKIAELTKLEYNPVNALQAWCKDRKSELDLIFE